MKKIVVIVCTIIVVLLCYLSQHVMVFCYIHPETNTESLNSLAYTIKFLDKAFKYAKNKSAKQGCKFNYVFFNAYGSGFLKNNDIPNDLDYSVGINLGKYKYDGKNSEQISKQIVQKISSFYINFYEYVNMAYDRHNYPTQTAFESEYYQNNNRELWENNIIQCLDKTFDEEYFLVSAQKNRITSEGNLQNYYVPYLMKNNTILLEKMPPIILYSDLIDYNKKQPKYERELSVTITFYADIFNKGKKYKIEFIPESYTGTLLELRIRIFQPNVYVHVLSNSFVNSKKYYQTDREYLMNQKDNFMEVNKRNIEYLSFQKKPIKLLKRLKQSLLILKYNMPKDKYDKAQQYIERNLSNKNIQLLNEYSNIVNNLDNIIHNRILLSRFAEDNKTKRMYDELQRITTELEQQKILSTNDISILNRFNNESVAKLFNIRTIDDWEANSQSFIDNYGDINILLTKRIYENIENVDNINKIIKEINDVYEKNGYREISIVCTDDNDCGILEDDITLKVKDWSKIEATDGIVDLSAYHLIPKSKISEDPYKYMLFIRNNTTREENANLDKLDRALLDNMYKNQKQIKIIFVK